MHALSLTISWHQVEANRRRRSKHGCKHISIRILSSSISSYNAWCW